MCLLDVVGQRGQFPVLGEVVLVLGRLPAVVHVGRHVYDVQMYRLVLLEAGRDRTETEGDAVALSRNVLALNVRNVYEKVPLHALRKDDGRQSDGVTSR